MSVMTNNNDNNIARKLHTDMLGVHHKSDKL